MRWAAGADDLVVGAAASTTHASDQVTRDGGYYNPATRTASPTIGADDLITGVDALMAGAGDQVARDGDFDSWNLISVQWQVLEIQSLESLLRRYQSLEWITGPSVASFGGLYLNNFTYHTK